MGGELRGSGVSNNGEALWTMFSWKKVRFRRAVGQINLRNGAHQHDPGRYLCGKKLNRGEKREGVIGNSRGKWGPR